MSNELFSIDSLINSTLNEGIQVTNTANSAAVGEILDKFGLRWTVTKTPLQLPGGKDTGFYGIVRDDTQFTFSTCKDSYQPFQNSELAELLYRIAKKTGYTIHSGGMFNGGGKVYLQLNTESEIKNLGKNNTTVKGYITGINGHDGTTSLKWGASNFTICCKNTFALAAKTLQESARHTESIHSRVDESVRTITGIQKAEQSIFDNFIRLSEIDVEKNHIAKIVKNITDVDILLKEADAKKEYSTRAINQSKDLINSITKEMNAKGQTLWGLFSGVTHYTSHVSSVPNRTNGRLESKYTGSGLKTDNEAYRQVLEFAGL